MVGYLARAPGEELVADRPMAGQGRIEHLLPPDHVPARHLHHLPLNARLIQPTSQDLLILPLSLHPAP